MSASALQAKKIVLAAGSQNVQSGASSGEVALAGKGFNEDVENKYREEGNLDYTWVDKMETQRGDSDQLSAFISAGRAFQHLDGGAQ